jgi:hypothetical protein
MQDAREAVAFTTLLPFFFDHFFKVSPKLAD